MTARKTRGIAILLGNRFTAGEALAMVIATTAATYAYENFDEFNKWLEKNFEKNPELRSEPIEREALMASIMKMIKMMPEEI